MKTTRIYKLYSASVASGNAVSSLRVVRAGMIVSIGWNVIGVGGAGANGCFQVELSKSNLSNIVTNDTPGNVLSQVNCAYPVAATAACSNSLQAGLAIPVEPAETLYLNTALTNVAPATQSIECFIAVLE